MFSVIIPLYNKENTICEAINSVLAQTFGDFELIVVDDGSKDRGVEKARQIADKRIRIIRQENRGVAGARNTGIMNAEREYICFLDADDLWLENHLESLRKLIRTYPDAGLYATMHRILLLNGSTHTPVMRAKTALIGDYFDFALNRGDSYLHTNSVCIPRRVFEKTGMFTVGERIGEDNAMWLRAAAYYSVALINSVTTLYRREYSAEYVGGIAMNRNWSFIGIAERDICNDETLPPAKIRSIKKYVNRYKLSLCRHALLAGDRASAKEDYGSVCRDLLSRKDRIVTNLCFCVPGVLLKKVYQLKNKNLFSRW